MILTSDTITYLIEFIRVSSGALTHKSDEEIIEVALRELLGGTEG